MNAAWIAVLQGEVEVTTNTDQRVAGQAWWSNSPPGERHALHARTNARILLMLTPWPGAGHPGAMTLENKAHVRERAAEHPFAE